MSLETQRKIHLQLLSVRGENYDLRAINAQLLEALEETIDAFSSMPVTTALAASDLVKIKEIHALAAVMTQARAAIEEAKERPV